MSDPIQLTDLPEPDITAPERIWARFEARRRRRALPVLLGACTVAVAVAAIAWVGLPSRSHPQSIVLDETELRNHAWSDTVQITAAGAGTLDGTGDALEVQWTSGTFEASVTPDTHTTVAVLTAEARIDVVGTVFDVTRDRLGTTVNVTRGKVQVTCEDGWDGLLDANSTRTCLPMSAAGLLGRAEELATSGASSRLVLESLDRGVRAATHDAVLGELLVLRMQTLSDAGAAEAAVADATQYLALEESPRSDQVQRFAGWLMLETGGCDAALSWLTPLAESGAGPETVLLAECLEHSDPEAAHDAVVRALPALDATWSDRAMSLLSRLE